MLKRLIKISVLSFKAAVNELIRIGIIESSKKKSSKKYVTKSHDAGEIFVNDIENIGALMSMFDEEKSKL